MKKKNVNIRTIAQMAGVSIASVSRALQEPPSPKISEVQRKHILDICSAMHYYPNAHTRRMFTRKSNTIAFLFPPQDDVPQDITGVGINFVSCMASVQRVLAENGYGMLLNEFNEAYLQDKSYLRMVRSNAVDGVLIWGALDSHDWLEELASEDIPVVMLQNVVANADFPFVICDNYSGMVEVVTNAIASGHRKFIFMTAPDGNSTARARNDAVRDTFKKFGITDVMELTPGGYGYYCGKNAASVLAQNRHATCFIASNDMAAWGCIDGLREYGLKVPEDISVTGADGINLPGTVKIESFGLPSSEIGIRGAELLLDIINGQKNAASVTLPVKTVRGNTIRKIC